MKCNWSSLYLFIFLNGDQVVNGSSQHVHWIWTPICDSQFRHILAHVYHQLLLHPTIASVSSSHLCEVNFKMLLYTIDDCLLLWLLIVFLWGWKLKPSVVFSLLFCLLPSFDFVLFPFCCLPCSPQGGTSCYKCFHSVRNFNSSLFVNMKFWSRRDDGVCHIDLTAFCLNLNRLAFFPWSF